MVSDVELYLVGSTVRGKPNPRDIDIVATMSEEEFQFAHGFTHESLQEAHKEKTESTKLKQWRHDCRVVERAFEALFGHKVDFKWLPHSMLYKPNKRVQVDIESLLRTQTLLEQKELTYTIIPPTPAEHPRDDLVSILYTCMGRPHLTELCLRRLIELMPEPYEIVLVYDGEDTDYVGRLLDIYNFDYIVMNPGRKNHRFYLMNEALDNCTGKYFMHMENDFYWDRPGVVKSALEALKAVPELDSVRFEFLPHTEGACQRTVQLRDDTLCIFKPGTPYAFNFNPHLRKEKFPVGRYPKEELWKPVQDEKWFGLKWEKRGKVAGCLTGPNFRHIGVYDEHGFYKVMYAERFTLRRSEGEFDPRLEFNSFCKNEEYRQLFDKYIESRLKRRVVILAFDGLDYSLVQRKCPELNQKIRGRIGLDNHIKGGGSPRPFTMEVFATLLTGTTPDIHGVREKFDYELTLKGKQKTIFELTDSVAVDVPSYNTHPHLRKFHSRCDWAFGFETFRKKLGMSEEEYWGKVEVSRDALERDLYDYLYTVKMDRIKEALSQKKNLTMIYFWFSDIIGHMGFKENDERIDRLYTNVRSVFEKIKEMIGDEVLIVLSDHGLIQGRHRPDGAFWSMSHHLMRGNQHPQMEEWFNIINRIVKK